jgi:undecaprenyl-diphosphatase
MQLAALAAVLSYFWCDVKALAVDSMRSTFNRQWQNPQLRLAVYLIVATIPIVIAGLALSHLLNVCNSPLRDLRVIGWACLAMSALLAFTERRARHARTMESASLVDAVIVGLAQAGALVPGVSRSGSTLTAALALGFKREEAARFSFLLGLPAIALAGCKELWELQKAHLSTEGWFILGVGLAVASISAFFAIWGLMRMLERFSAWPFVIYRAVLGIVLLMASASGWLT